MLEGACETLLFTNGTFAVLRLHPLRCWAAISGEQSGIDAVTMEFPAGIIFDALQADIDARLCRDAGKDLDELGNVGDQKVAHIAGLHTTLIQERLKGGPEFAGLDEKPKIGQRRYRNLV